MVARRREWVARTLKDVGAFFGVSYQTVKQWRQNGMPNISAGGYYLPDVAAWRHRKVGRTTAAQATGKDQLERQKLEIDNARRLLAFKRESGELVSRAVATATFEELLHRLRTRLESVPEEIGSSFPAEVRGELIADAERKVRLICREIENWSLDAVTE